MSFRPRFLLQPIGSHRRPAARGWLRGVFGLAVAGALPAIGAPAAPTPAASAEVCVSPLPKRPRTPATQRMVDRLSTLGQDIDPLAIPFFAAKAAAFFKAKIAETHAPAELAALKLPYAIALLNDGQSEEALRQLLDYERILSENGLSPKPENIPRILETKALCYLRIGEQQNCLTNHNADSCLLPIRGGGVHQHPEGSRGAIAVLNDSLARYPSPFGAWLLNIAYMTLGEYPDKVPPRWLIPPAVFRSNYDIKRFPDVAGSLGLDVDDLSGGVVMEDFDRDGFLDLLVSASGLQSQLRYFRNNGDGTFTELTDSAGLTGLYGGLNLIQGDYDNDGLADVLVLRGGWLGKDGRYPNSLLRNNGDNTFTDVTEETGLLSFHPTQTAVWFDYNADGWLDIFIGNETVPGSPDQDPCELYRNNGDGTFTECAAENGLAIVDWIKAVVTGDFNNDGRPDLYLSSLVGPNRLLRNDGPAGADHGPRAPRRFTDVAVAAGVTEPLKSFPCWFWDFDNDGWLDIFVTGYSIKDAGDIAADYLGVKTQAERARLYYNNRDGTFTDVTEPIGLSKVLHAMGANFGDLDNDGFLDMYLGTGDPSLGTIIPNRMFRYAGDEGFQDVTTSGGFGQLQKGHGIAFGDVNNDGTQDIYSVVGGALSGDHYPNQLFANPGHGNHWLKLELQGVQSNRPALGARIKVVVRTAAGEREIHRVVGSGGSFGASPLRQEIGLGRATAIARVEIFWPKTGLTQVIGGLALDRSYRVKEGDPVPVVVAEKSFAWPDAAHGPAHHHPSGAAMNAHR